MRTHATDILGPNGLPRAKFSVGQLVHHRLYGYRGVVIDADPEFQLTEEWYEQTAVSRPPRDKPWYHVLVNDSDEMTYVAERNLEPDVTGKPISHPLTFEFFETFEDGHYISRTAMN
jgi:heat shock protein HspQ